jgi:glutamate formiminotransferase
VAFNVELAPPATLQDACRIAAVIREGGSEGLAGVRAIGLWLDHLGVAQVSTNVEDHRATTLAQVVAAVARHARPSGAELVGLAPQAAFEGFPEQVPLRGYATIEDTLAALS